MAIPPSSFDKWRDYFRSINTDIFNIIEHAIMVAAKDYPYDFKLKRDRITEVLFACKITKCVGCDNIELAVPNRDDDDDDDNSDLKRMNDEFNKSGYGVGGSKDTKESKVSDGINKPSSGGDADDDDDVDRQELPQTVEDHLIVCSYGDAEALTDEIEEESQLFDEVLRIKGIIDKRAEVSSEVLLHSLRRLQHIHLSVETLRATKIGISVRALRKHRSKDIQNLSKTLIEAWMVKVDDWVRTTSAIAEAESRSLQKTPVGEEEEAGLPSPPLDEAAFFATPNSMELSEFFEGMDDDLNFQNGGEFEERGTKPVQQKPIETRTEPKRNQEKKQTPISKPDNIRQQPPSGGESRSRMQNPALKPKTDDDIKVVQKPMPPQRERLKDSNEEASVQNKLEVSKRKLHERYQEAERAKKQRTVQVVELRDLPKQCQRNQHAKPIAGLQNKLRANGRR